MIRIHNIKKDGLSVFMPFRRNLYPYVGNVVLIIGSNSKIC